MEGIGVKLVEVLGAVFDRVSKKFQWEDKLCLKIAKGHANETNNLWHPRTVKAYERIGSTFQLEKYFER